MMLIKPLILISIPSEIEAYKVILAKLLAYREKYHIPLGIEICLSGSIQESVQKIRLVKRVLNKYNIPLAIYLPVLPERDLEELLCLNYLKLEYIVTQGLTSNNDKSGDYMDICNKTASMLSSMNKQGIELLIKNSVYPAAGILSSDLLKISRDSNCGILIDSESLLHTISAVRNWSRSKKASPSDEEDKECFQQYGFFVHSGRVLCPLKSLKTLTLENQLIWANTDRYHISGSNTVITEKSMIKQSEIQYTPFHRYLASTILKMNPKSITVKSYCSDGTHDLDITLRSLRTLLNSITDEQIKEVQND
ncbi:MAG: hypothetical protein PHX16_03585 [Syntrophaceticus sp.]|nr:hypothetical protein [Syntrophaceticus sp.]MDD4360178.1 hypothetical protein [Syntrophaceticus sp.]MDD4782715.1 hypothetical protein [Syntrophaceticus sp.]